MVMPDRHSSLTDGAAWQQSRGAMWFLVCCVTLATLWGFYVGFIKLTALAGTPAGVEAVLFDLCIAAILFAGIAAIYRCEKLLLTTVVVWSPLYYSAALWLPVPADMNHAPLFTGPAFVVAATFASSWWLWRRLAQFSVPPGKGIGTRP